jgi:hypothetical protein
MADICVASTPNSGFQFNFKLRLVRFRLSSGLWPLVTVGLPAQTWQVSSLSLAHHIALAVNLCNTPKGAIL